MASKQLPNNELLPLYLYKSMNNIKIIKDVNREDEKGIINSYFDMYLHHDFEGANTMRAKYKISIYATNSNGDTLLHTILKYIGQTPEESEENTIELLNNIPDIWKTINIKNNDKQTPLHYICMYQLTKIYKSIPSEYEINYNIKDIYKRYPLHYTIIGKKIDNELISYILEYLKNHTIDTTSFEDFNKNRQITNNKAYKKLCNIMKDILNKNIFLGDNTITIPVIGTIQKIIYHDKFRIFLKNVYRDTDTLKYYYFVKELYNLIEPKTLYNNDEYDAYAKTIENYKNNNLLLKISKVEDNKIYIIDKTFKISKTVNNRDKYTKLKSLGKLGILKLHNFILYNSLFIPIIDEYLNMQLNNENFEEEFVKKINETLKEKIVAERQQDNDKVSNNIFYNVMLPNGIILKLRNEQSTILSGGCDLSDISKKIYYLILNNNFNNLINQNDKYNQYIKTKNTITNNILLNSSLDKNNIFNVFDKTYYKFYNIINELQKRNYEILVEIA